MNSDNRPFHEAVAEKLIRQLAEGTAPWQKPWDAGEAGAVMPVNPVSGKRYRGINALHLMSEGREDQRWMTYKQATAMDAHVRKGEHGTQIQYWKFTEEQARTDAAGKPVLDAGGVPLRDTVRLERPRVFFATVFNAEQIDGLPPPAPRPQHAWSAAERAEQILLASGAVISNSEHDRAFYRPSTDSIHLPDRGRFRTADNYYATALHELGHWSGHETRLGRDLAHPFGSAGYAREELRAEIASMILGDELGIGHDPAQHAAYVGSWIRALEEDPLEIFRAAADAERIQEFVLGPEQRLRQERAIAEVPAPGETEKDAMELPLQSDAADSSVARAETWVLSRVEKGTFFRATDQASVAQLERMDRILAAMAPLSAPNPFWQRHQLPQDVDTLRARIDDACVAVAQRHADAPVAAARMSMLVARAAGSTDGSAAEAFDQAASEAAGFTLPHDWNGIVRIEGKVLEEVDGKVMMISALGTGVQATSWDIYAQHEDGTHSWLANHASEELADALAERLRLIDANSTIDEYEKAAKLARINEERVRRDPGSTDEDITSAKEARKDAEFRATANDADLQRRIEVEERRRARLNAKPSIADTRADSQSADKSLIDVPYKEKEEAKALGAKWDRQAQSWYVPAGVDAGPLSKWAVNTKLTPPASTLTDIAAADGASLQVPARQRRYLAVPYSERAEAKLAGAAWDGAARSWYAGPKADLALLAKWNPENIAAQQGPAMTVREEFAEALKSLGCVITGDHPVMDGRKHRITVDGEKFSKSSGSGFYVGHLDGHPAGYIKNNKTGVEMNWKSRGYVLDPAQKALLAAEADAKLLSRAATVAKQHEQAATRVARQVRKLVQVVAPTPYMAAKGIDPQPGALTDKEGTKTYLPAIDVAGRQWSMQYIQEDGKKRFARDSRKEGCFHVVGGLDRLREAPVLVIGEGYATAVQLTQSLGYATVCAFDSGNLAPVAQALHEKFPDKSILIAGDDDRHLELTQGVNPGRLKAEEAATLVGGTAVLPIFAPGENSLPDELPAITPAKYREHRKTGRALDNDQLAALERLKQFTDFNDLAVRSQLGEDGVRRQLRPIVDSLLAKSSAVSDLRQGRTCRQGADPENEGFAVKNRGIAA